MAHVFEFEVHVDMGVAPRSYDVTLLSDTETAVATAADDGEAERRACGLVAALMRKKGLAMHAPSGIRRRLIIEIPDDEEYEVIKRMHDAQVMSLNEEYRAWQTRQRMPKE